MTSQPTGCLLLACGNTLRSDDGVGPWLAAWAEQHFEPESRVRILAGQQWTPEIAVDLASASSVLFVDCSVDSPPGEVLLRAVMPADDDQARATHHLGAAQLLFLTRELYGTAPQRAVQLTIGAGSLAMGEGFSPEVARCLPDACGRLQDTVLELLAG